MVGLWDGGSKIACWIPQVEEAGRQTFFFGIKNCYFQYNITIPIVKVWQADFRDTHTHTHFSNPIPGLVAVVSSTGRREERLHQVELGAQQVRLET